MTLSPSLVRGAPDREPERTSLLFKSSPLLAVDGVTKTFGGVTAVSDVSWTAEAGAAIGIIGPNGAGKSTLLKLLAGSLRPGRGEVRFHREPLSRSPHRVARAGIAMAHQTPRPFRSLSVRDNVRVAVQRSWRPPSGTAGHQPVEVQEARERCGLGDKAAVPAGTLGLLDLKQLEVARALALQPSVLMLDEVAAGLNGRDLDQAIALIAGVRPCPASAGGRPKTSPSATPRSARASSCSLTMRPPTATRAPTPNPSSSSWTAARSIWRSGGACTAASACTAAPSVFTKFPALITGPKDVITLPCATVDWEVELVVAIGRMADRVSEEAAWSHVAGLMVGQDLSERTLQLAGSPPQFSLGKSYRGFAPLGPSLVTADEVRDPDNLALGCDLDGEVMQQGQTRDMLFTIPEQISRLSAVCPLLQGDIIFTGTPADVGAARTPPRFIAPGAVLRSWVEGVGELRNTFTADPGYTRPLASQGAGQ